MKYEIIKKFGFKVKLIIVLAVFMKKRFKHVNIKIIVKKLLSNII